jgi:hypothetical protein
MFANLVDVDGSGQMSTEELRAALTQSFHMHYTGHQFFEVMRVIGPGQSAWPAVSYEEFVRFIFEEDFAGGMNQGASGPLSALGGRIGAVRPGASQSVVRTVGRR